ncbi:PaaX family transcriptional regulator [Streptantibioticus cattleyicolor]|uniref:Transcriptional regulator, PaaX family n=1 Tax=Streptantibioticus cattleyicolor (strain ATCC 35852 / DSM 46488 / JCM 4925 / NBRC 14057 / NRRL 8057) TaxID=1003195 RepID=F8JL30_STREN|nr:PaaX family transcriptional regulator C-terminal domain-containing protein [Streptantibioticus cattleyicolor]AEW98391.1 transcriptional regulator, PaaX family [Streptantibioticus cattleyicolor NRRL 8057 = DSM 46488]CCB72550.1 putative regulator [Streptantibioticus cattleyicolor NRRL 8057 = DSM 46488]
MDTLPSPKENRALDVVVAAAGTRPRPGRDTRLGPLILTVLGLYARGEHNWLSVASVVRLMADLGVEGQAVRSAIWRLKRRGVIHGERRGGAAGYRLAEPTLETLAEGDVRIFERTRATTDDGWLVVVFSVPESERDKRHELRTALTRLGFGTAAPGVWVAPGNLATETRRTLERRGLAGYVDIFTGDHVAFGDLRAKVAAWWDLDELTGLYADFLRAHRPLLDTVAAGRTTPAEAFRAYVPMLTQWRRLPYRDPGLPLALLPPGWNGVTAGALFAELNTALRAPAREHALSVIHG